MKIDSIPTDRWASDVPSNWVLAAAAHFLTGGRVLDLACGGLRHSRLLAELGFQVVAVDRSERPATEAFGPHKERIDYRQIDLEVDIWPLAGELFEAIVVTNYLHRPLLPCLVSALVSGGVLVYETFEQGNEAFGRPTRPEFLLKPGELLDVLAPHLAILSYEHGQVLYPRRAVIQRIVARRM